MARAFETFVAMRYLRDRSARYEGRGFVRFVIMVGVGGVAVGVAALLVALSVVHGFSREITDKIVGFGADLQVESQTDSPLRDANEIESGVRAMKGVVDVRPIVENFVLMRRSSTDIDGVVLSGVRVLPEYLATNITAGTDAVADGAGLVIGQGLAGTQMLAVGDRVTLFAISGPGAGMTQGSKPRVRQLPVIGIYETSLADFDNTFVFADIETARDLFAYDADSITRFDVSVERSTDRATLVEEIESRFGFPVMVRQIEEVYRSLFAWVRLQESIIPVVIGFIVLVAVFNIGGILLMIVMEKTRSLGVMVSMGVNRRSIRTLVLTLAGLIGVAGIVLGEGVALLLAAIQKRYGVIPLPADAYYMTTAPIETHLLDFVFVAVATLILCVLFAYIPAHVASKLDPIRVIRFE